MMQCFLLVVGLEMAPGLSLICEINGVELSRVRSPNEDAANLRLSNGLSCSIRIQGIRVYTLGGQPLTPSEAKTCLRPGTLVLLVPGHSTPKWLDLVTDVLFLPRDTLIVTGPGKFTARSGRFDVENNPISCLQVLKDTLIDRPMNLLPRLAGPPQSGR